MILNLVFLFLAYLAGSINFSIIIFHLLGKGDPRQKYSQNPGATNVYRQAGKWWALCVLLLDMTRAAGVALAALYYLAPGAVTFSGLGLLLGNRFPCFHGFRGGKGVANYLGFTAVVAPMWAGLAAVAWAAAFGLARIPFISSFCMVSILAFGVMQTFNFKIGPVIGTAMTLLLIFVNHKQNITDFYHPRKRKQ